MNLLSFNKTTYTTSLTPNEILNLLNKYVEEGSLNPISRMWRHTDKPYYGKLNNQNFKIVTSSAKTNSIFSPIINGTIEERNGINQIHIHLSYSLFVFFHQIISYGILFGVFLVKPLLQDPNYKPGITPCIILIASILISAFHFWRKSVQTKKFLSELFSNKL